MCNNYDQVTYCPVVQFVTRLNRIGVWKELKTVFGFLSAVDRLYGLGSLLKHCSSPSSLYIHSTQLQHGHTRSRWDFSWFSALLV